MTEENKILVEIRKVIKNITDTLSDLNKIMTKPISNQEVWLKNLRKTNDFIQWTLTKYKLQFKGSPNKVFRGEIFYCNLGYNIGSEQDRKRPVVVLQNNGSNAKSTVTIIIPITTIEGTIEETENGHIVKSIDKDGKEKTKKIDLEIEIPIKIEPGYKKLITGYADVGQIRTVSKKRLDAFPVAVMEGDTILKIEKGLKKIMAFQQT